MPQPLVTLEPSALAVTPGEETAGSVVVVNRSDVVDEIQLAVLGPAAAWARIEPPAARLFPGAREALRLVLAPPPGPAVPAGVLTLGVRAVSTSDGGSTVVEAVVTVGVVADVRYSLTPKRARGRRAAKATVEVSNQGNESRLVRLTAPVEDDEIDVRLQPDRVTVAAGTVGRARVRIKPLRSLFVGQPVSRQYGVQLTPDRGAAGRVDGTAVQLPFIGRGAGVLAVLLAAVLVAILVARGLNTGPASQARDDAPPTAVAVASSGATTSASGSSSSASGGGSGSASPSALPPAVARMGGSFHPLSATRILDTSKTSALAPDARIDVPIVGTGGVPSSGAAAVVVDFIVNPNDIGDLVAWPAGATQPAQAAVTYEKTGGQWEWTTSAMTIAPGTAGSMTLLNQSNQAVNVRVDIEGWYGTGPSGSAGLFNPVTPARLLDTASKGGPISSGGCVEVGVAGSPGVPKSGVGAAVLTLTARNQQSTEAYLEAFPSGGTHPFPSLVGAFKNSTVANQAIVPVGANGRVTVCDSGGATNLSVDLYGWYTDGSAPDQNGLLFQPVPLSVVCDADQPGDQCSGPLSGGTSVDIQVTGMAGVPGDGDSPRPRAVALAVSVRHGSGQPGTLRVLPSGATLSPDPNARPVAASWTDATGGSAMVVVGIGAKGKVTLLQGGPDTISEQVGIMGWFD